ncbi:MAG: aminoacyl-tRNA hydrolase [Tissierellia bacterium]|nr:aminoacyl-tRNA hydrolase [Tissierellia bacterium]
MYIIVGLGNPGKKYEGNRHNVGFMTIDKLASIMDINVNRLKFKGLYGQGMYKGEKVILLKPQTYMNASGESVVPFVNYYDIDLENLIVITDDIDIDFGMVRVRKKGSAGTHNGMKSIISLLGDSDFPRVKIAVGKKPSYMDLADFVLSNFRKDEIDTLEKEIELASDAVLEMITNGLDASMNKINSIRIE